MSNSLKAYKGFNKDMTCRGFQYQEGQEYEHSGDVKACKSGFHACENPIECLRHYNPAESVYHEVVLTGKIDRGTDDSKIAASHIRIGARLDMAGLCKATFEFVRSKCTNENKVGLGQAATAGNWGAAIAGHWGTATTGRCGVATAGRCGAATAGDYGAATAGDYGAATAGDYGAATACEDGAATAGIFGAATAGNCGAATAGICGAATAGCYGVATAGDYGAATAGGNGAATAGNYGTATAGIFGTATSRGSSGTGENGLSVARGKDVKVKGGLGALLVIAEEDESSSNIKEWKAAVVDGTNIKPDVWYKLIDGEFVEA